MKSTFAVLLATTAVIGALGLPALSAIGRDPDTTSITAATVGNDTDGAIRLASSDDDDNRKASRRDDDHEDDDDDEDECDDDEVDCRRPAPAMTPTGPIAPPTNGLFSPGAAPKVRTN